MLIARVGAHHSPTRSRSYPILPLSHLTFSQQRDSTNITTTPSKRGSTLARSWWILKQADDCGVHHFISFKSILSICTSSVSMAKQNSLVEWMKARPGEINYCL